MQSIVRRFTFAVVTLAIVLAAVPLVAAEGQVNVNTATAQELERLPGVGPTLAARILEHREKNGAFKRVEDLMLIKGIGEKSFERLKPYVAVSGNTTLGESVRMPRAKPAAAAER